MSKKSKIYEPKKTINISLQSKKYFKTINDILKEWDDNDLQTSTEVCESIILSNKFKKSITLLGILNAYKMAENMLEVYSIGKNNDNLDDKLEEILSSAISIDINKLMDAVREQSYREISNKPINKEVENIEVIEEVPVEVEPTKTKTKMLSNYNPNEILKEETSKEIKEEISVTKNENIVEINVVNDTYNDDEDDKYANLPTDLLFNS